LKNIILCLLLLSALVSAKSIIETLDAPDTNISGLAWNDGKLWAVDEVTDYVYCMDAATGTVESSFYVAHSSAYFPTGLAYSANYDLVLVGLWNNATTGYVYKYTPAGTFSGSVDMCGG